MLDQRSHSAFAVPDTLHTQSATLQYDAADLRCAVGDIHGDLAKAINALKVAGLMDDDSGSAGVDRRQRGLRADG